MPDKPDTNAPLQPAERWFATVMINMFLVFVTIGAIGCGLAAAVTSGHTAADVVVCIVCTAVAPMLWSMRTDLRAEHPKQTTTPATMMVLCGGLQAMTAGCLVGITVVVYKACYMHDLSIVVAAISVIALMVFGCCSYLSAILLQRQHRQIMTLKERVWHLSN